MSDPAAGGDGPLRVFISSTPADLQEQREAIREAVLGLDHHPDDMIYWSADERSGATHSVARVRRSDVLILVVAHRYGHVPTHGLHSVTELEYRAAHAADIPVLAFFLNPAVAWPPTHVEWEAREKLAEFKALVETQVTKKTFHTTDELARQVVQALALLTARQQATPPVRRRFRGPARTTSLRAPLTTEPDVLIPIGTAEDGCCCWTCGVAATCLARSPRWPPPSARAMEASWPCPPPMGSPTQSVMGAALLE